MSGANRKHSLAKLVDALGSLYPLGSYDHTALGGEQSPPGFVTIRNGQLRLFNRPTKPYPSLTIR
ncbi:hypothetical protein D3C77_347490 [compost metagenome]